MLKFINTYIPDNNQMSTPKSQDKQESSPEDEAPPGDAAPQGGGAGGAGGPGQPGAGPGAGGAWGSWGWAPPLVAQPPGLAAAAAAVPDKGERVTKCLYSRRL